LDDVNASAADSNADLEFSNNMITSAAVEYGCP